MRSSGPSVGLADLVGALEGLEDVEPYREHEEHRYFVDEFLDARIKVIKAWNFACD